MKILVDALTAREGGGVTYLRNALPKLQEQEPDWTFTVILSADYQQKFIQELSPDLSMVTPRVKASPPLQRFRFLRKEVPGLIREGSYDLFFSVAEASTWNTPCPRVVMVRNPNFFAPLERVSGLKNKASLLLYKTLWRPIVRGTLKHADRVCFVSNAFQQEVSSVLKLDPTKSSVVYHGLNPAFTTSNSHEQTSANEGRPFILSVSSLAPHKDFITLIRGFARVATEIDELDLLIAGAQRNVAVFQELVDEVERLNIKQRVRFLGPVPSEQLPQLYANAKCFVLTSRLETFGHPLVEAMACGCPVVTTALPVCREICGDAAEYFVVGDAADLSESILSLLRVPEKRQAMRAAGLERSKAFSWSATARSMVEVFRDVAALGADRRVN